MKIIFLDVDGVLNCRNTFAYSTSPFVLEPNFIKRLKLIIKKTGAKVVLSSVWRKWPEGRELLKQHFHYIDETIILDAIRGEEIKEWLSRHPRVEKYAILDDDSDMLPNQPLFQTTFEHGLTEKITQQIITYLEKI